MFEQQIVPTGEVALNFAHGPASGPPLLFLHGVTRRWQDFVALFPALMPRWQVFGLDHRGHGRSARASDRYLVADYARDAAAVVRSQFAEPVVIYGHSLGAMVAAAVAAECSDRVRGLILEDPPFDTLGSRIAESVFHNYFVELHRLTRRVRDADELNRELPELRFTVPGQSTPIRLGDTRDPASIRFSARCLSLLDPEVFTPLVAGHWLDGYDTASILSRITCPTLLLQADIGAGGMLPDVDADHVASLIADCSHVRLPGVGHLIHWMQTETTLRLVLNFLESLNE